MCPKCGSYVELTKEEFEKAKMNLNSKDGNNTSTVDDRVKYSGKTETQINYLKQMEELKK
jgi:uncharacterized Zn finger protein (UPF0148 family)